jgi:hypothetical protein
MKTPENHPHKIPKSQNTEHHNFVTLNHKSDADSPFEANDTQPGPNFIA